MGCTTNPLLALSTRCLGGLACIAMVLLSPGCTVWQKGAIAPGVVVEGVHTGAEALDFDPSSSLLASGGWDGRVAVWHPNESKPLHVWQAHDGWIQGIVFLDGRILTGGFDGQIRVWRTNGEAVGGVDARSPITRMIAHGEHLVTGHQDGYVRFWDLTSLRLLSETDAHSEAISALAGDPRAARVASSALDGDVYLISASGTKTLAMRPSRVVSSLSFDLDGGTLYGGTWFDIVRWDVNASGQTTALGDVRTPHWGNIIGLQYLSSESGLATISRTNDSSVLFLNPDTGAIIQHFERQAICGGAVKVSQDGRLMATTGDDGVVRIWDFNAQISISAALSNDTPETFP
ncbi:MAG: hypothetical protein K0U93_26735 [Gammaproteobacteria bacterium]|nr:hypothetical protein [Gammaproteobacteria bacterium]